MSVLLIDLTWFSVKKQTNLVSSGTCGALDVLIVMGQLSPWRKDSFHFLGNSLPSSSIGMDFQFHIGSTWLFSLGKDWTLSGVEMCLQLGIFFSWIWKREGDGERHREKENRQNMQRQGLWGGHFPYSQWGESWESWSGVKSQKKQRQQLFTFFFSLGFVRIPTSL